MRGDSNGQRWLVNWRESTDALCEDFRRRGVRVFWFRADRHLHGNIQLINTCGEVLSNFKLPVGRVSGGRLYYRNQRTTATVRLETRFGLLASTDDHALVNRRTTADLCGRIHPGRQPVQRPQAARLCFYYVDEPDANGTPSASSIDPRL